MTGEVLVVRVFLHVKSRYYSTCVSQLLCTCNLVTDYSTGCCMLRIAIVVKVMIFKQLNGIANSYCN